MQPSQPPLAAITSTWLQEVNVVWQGEPHSHTTTVPDPMGTGMKMIPRVFKIHIQNIFSLRICTLDWH